MKSRKNFPNRFVVAVIGSSNLIFSIFYHILTEIIFQKYNRNSRTNYYFYFHWIWLFKVRKIISFYCWNKNYLISSVPSRCLVLVQLKRLIFMLWLGFFYWIIIPSRVTTHKNHKFLRNAWGNYFESESRMWTWHILWKTKFRTSVEFKY